MTTARRLLRLLRPSRGRLAAALVLTVLSSAGIVALPLLVGKVTDALHAGDQGRLHRTAALILIVGLAGTAATWARRVVLGRLAWREECQLRQRLFDHALAVEMDFVSTTGTGQIVSRATTDVQEVGFFLGYGLGGLASIACTALGAIAVMAYIHPLLTLAALVPLPFAAVIARRYNRRATPVQQDVLQQLGEVTRRASEDVEGLTVIKAFGAAPERLRGFCAAVEELFGHQSRAIRLRARYQPMIAFVGGLSFAVALGLGAEFAVDGRISVGQFAAFYVYLGVLLVPLSSIGAQLDGAQTAVAAARRIFAIVDHEPALAVGPAAEQTFEGEGRLELQGVTVTLGDAQVLEDIDVEVAPGRTLALVGAAGSGKTVLMGALWRVRDPAAGRVLLDGRDLRTLAPHALHRAIGVLGEEPILMTATLRDNIASGRPEATPERVERAARAAGVHDAIEAMPDGYDTLVGERGQTLSGGERQRVALARALATAPRVLLLDDASASLDARTEQQLLEAVRQQGCTTIVVSRRPAWLEWADEVLLLGDGGIAERGLHADLQSRSGRYRALTDAPSADETPETRAAASRGLPGGRRTPPTETTSRSSEEASPAPSRRVRLRTLRAVWPWVRPYRGRVALAALSVVVATGAMLVPAYLAGATIDQVIDKGDRSKLVPLLAAFLGAALVVWGATTVQTRLVQSVGARVLADLRIAILEHLHRLPRSFVDRARTGALLSRVTNDVEAMETLVSDAMITLLQSVLLLLGPVIVMLELDTDLALLALVTFPVLTLAVVGYRWLSAGAYRAVRRVVAAVTAHVHEALRALPVIHACDQEPRERDGLRTLNDETIALKMRTTHLSAAYYGLVEAYLALSLALVAYVGGDQVIDGAVALGVLVTFVVYLQQFSAPIEALASLSPIYQSATAAFSHILDLLDEAPERDRPGATQLPRGLGHVRFENAGASYAPGTWAVRGVDLDVPPHSTLAIVGHTGAGKTTLAALLARLYEPAEGRVTIDGYDVMDVTLDSLRREIGLLPQETFLFAGTVADNVRLGRPDADRTEIAAAASALGLDDRGITLDQEVGEGGSALSAGQRQLVSLARVLLADPPVVVLDEATSRMDRAGEERVAAALGRVLSGRVVMLIAHRLATIRNADRIAVLDHGRLVEHGTHDELLAADGHYARLYEAWSSAMEPV